MRYKKFGRTGLNVSVLGVGTWAIGGDHWGPINDDESIAAIQAMIDDGVNLIDTAPGYNWGHSEQIVGRAVQGRRDKVFISTKGGIMKPDFAKNSSRAFLLKEVDQSLSNLQTDYIDFYFIHWPDEKTPFEETMATLEALRQSGKIRFIGVSNFTQKQIEDAGQYGTIDVLQPPYSMVDRVQEPLLKWSADQGIATMTYASLGAGILSGAHRTVPDFAADDFRMSFYNVFHEPRFSKIQQLLLDMDEIAAKYHATAGQVAINWSTQKTFVSTALIGVRSARHAHENCGGMNWTLTEAEMTYLDARIDEYLA